MSVALVLYVIGIFPMALLASDDDADSIGWRSWLVGVWWPVLTVVAVVIFFVAEPMTRRWKS